MPLPKDLCANVLPVVSKQEEFDYGELSGWVVRFLQQLEFPIVLELRTKRHDGFSVVNVDFHSNAIQRVQTDLLEGGYDVEIQQKTINLGNEYMPVHFQIMRITKHVVNHVEPNLASMPSI